jgi:uncharacterized protein YxjI
MATPPTYHQARAQAYPFQISVPSAAPFALFPAFAAQKPETLIVKAQSVWTDGKYSVKTIDGRLVFNTDKGESLSFSYRRRVYDINDTHLFTIKRESRVFQPTIYHALPPSGTGARLFECQFDPWASGDKCTGHFVNAINGKQEHFFLKGNFLQSKATISNQETGQSVAEIKKQSWTLKTEYHITVAPGVDLALVVALCLISHDRQESHRSSGAGAGGGGA